MVSGTASAATVPSQDQIIAVIYPETAKPYRAVFASILAGVEKRLGNDRIQQLAIRDGVDSQALRQWLARENPGAVITLGRLAYQRYRETGAQYPYVIGALDVSPDTHGDEAGVNLSADPRLLFQTLKLLSPRTQRVLVVFNPKRDKWLVELARDASGEFALTVEAFEAASLKEATQHFWNIFKYSNPSTDALWLTVDNMLVDANNLPVIVEQSWARRMPVFSNNLEHANRGVLFAVFPDPEPLGVRLAEFAEQLAKNPDARRTIEPLRDVKRALNTRISSHLGLDIAEPTRRQFDLVFPRR